MQSVEIAYIQKHERNLALIFVAPFTDFSYELGMIDLALEGFYREIKFRQG